MVDDAWVKSKVFLGGDNPASNLHRANVDFLGYPPKPLEPPEIPKDDKNWSGETSDLETEPK